MLVSDRLDITVAQGSISGSVVVAVMCCLRYTHHIFHYRRRVTGWRHEFICPSET